MISPQKIARIRERMTRLGIREQDLEERFIRGSGPGGQKINKTSSTVWLRHKPSGIEIKCGRERSQVLNRHLARRALCYRLEERRQGALSARRQAIEKIRRQKRRRSRRQRERLLADKHHRSRIKQERSARGLDE